MADYLRFRVTAARAGVSMVLLALIGGLAARDESAPATVNATPAASSGLFLKLGGITGNAKTSFLKLEQKVRGIDRTLASLEQKLGRSYYTEQKVNSTFLKIRDAGAQYLKIRSADTSFLKIDDAAKIYLTSTDAAAKFLKLDGTAVNANELGGQAPSAFFQGRGNVVSGAVSFGDGSVHPLLSTPGGIIAVSVAANVDQFQLTIHNGTNASLPAVQTGAGGTPAEINLAPNGDTLLPAVQHVGAGQVQVQVFPNVGAGFNNVMSLLVSLERPVGQTQTSVVGQLFTGGV